MSGWIKLQRKILDWEWFKTPNMFVIFGYLLLKSNHTKKRWQGIEIDRGSFITSVANISKDTGVSIQSVRTCLKRLEKTSEINIQTNKLHSVVTICNYDSYNSKDDDANKETNKQLTNGQQTANKQLTTTKNDKNIKNDKNEKKFSEFWNLYDKKVDHKKCKNKFINLTDAEIDKIFSVVSAYVESTPGKKYRKNPLTWLNGKCWEDDISTNKSISRQDHLKNSLKGAL